MSAIGSGDWVQAVRSRKHWPHVGIAITKGAVYQIACVGETGRSHCETCKNHVVIALSGQVVASPDGAHYGWCPCHFAPWPPPADEALRSEPVDADEPQSVPA